MKDSLHSTQPMTRKRATRLATGLIAGGLAATGLSSAQPYLDNESIYSNQDPNTETRRSDHFRLNFGHYNRDTGTPMTEQLAQGNLQMFEQMWHRWVVEMGLHDINESATNPDGNKYRANFNVLMTWDDGGGGGAYSSMDSGGFGYAMANTGYCRFDPPSGATPHEFGHAWQITTGGFNGSNSSGAWWECHANWMQLQFLNSYPQAGGYLYNSVFYPAHGRDYYDSWMIFEAASEDPRYGPAWVNEVWTNATEEQKVNEYILDRMIRLDSSGSPDKAGALKDLWGDMARKMVTWDYARQRWLAQANTPWNGDTWEWYTRCRAPLVKMPATPGWYRPARAHIPQQFGFHFVPLAVTAGTTVSCNFQPLSDFVRQSDWRACLVAVNHAGEASYSPLWNIGNNSITLSSDQNQLYLMVIAVPKPMKIGDPVWAEYTRDSGLQFPYTVSFTNASPQNVIYPAQNRSGMHQHANGGGWVANTATVDATAYVGPNAQVLNSAQVRGNARIEEYAVVRNNAQVRDNAVISGHGMVYENAQVYGNAKVRDWAMVFGSTELYENAKAIEHAGCGGGDAANHNRVSGSAVLKGVTSIYSPSTFSGSLITDGDTANGGTGDRGVHFGWQWGQNPSIFTGLTDNGYQYSGLTFERDNPVFAIDQHGINHGYLMNGCRTAKDSGASVRGGRVLPLDGVSQYVELHNSLNDFKDSTFALWFKSSGGSPDQRLWSLGDGGSKVMSLTHNDSATGALRFVISDGTTTQTLDGPAIAANTWRHVAVVFSGTTCTLHVDGTAVASNAAMTLLPESLNAPLMENANYLGRGNAGNHFQGVLDDFRMYNKALGAAEVTALFNTAAPAPINIAADTTAPSPNAATWLVAPMANGDSTVTMSATPGTDASGWVEYYFTCVAGGGHDSGWVSFNKYTDVGLPPGAAPTYTVKLRDRNGNTTAASTPATVTLATSSAGTASFSYGPVGIADGQITMTASKATNASGKVEYKFDRTAPTVASSGWQSSPTWTNSGLTTGTSYTYTVTIRDGRGNTSSPSSPASALARDDAGPVLPIAVAHWQMLPYATIDNKVSMTAQTTSDPAGVEYLFHCVSGGGPDSAWQASPTYVTPSPLPDGTYVYQYKVRDKSARNNESPYSTSYPAKITPTTGYHPVTFAEVSTLPDDCLVTFNGVVMQANADHYVVKDVASNATIKVKSDAYALATDPSKALKLCQIKGHLWTYGGTRVVTYASLSTIMDPPAFAVSGKVSKAGGGTGIGGATVSFSSIPGAAANAILTATTDANGNYSKPLPNGLWYVSAAAPDHFPSADQAITVNGSPVGSVNFTLNPAATITASVSGGGSISPAGAVLLTSGANQTFTITPNGGQSIANVQIDGVDYGSITSYTFNNVTTSHTIVATFTTNTSHIPQPASLVHSALAETFPASGLTGNWASYLPAGLTYTTIGSPTVSTVNNAKWDLNLYTDGDGFRLGQYTSAIPVNGATFVCTIKPVRNSTSTSWTSIIDVMYGEMVLGIRNNTGEPTIRLKKNQYNGTTAIPNGQVTILTLVVQPAGTYTLYANGVSIMSGTGPAMTQWVPGNTTNTTANPNAYDRFINVGRNEPDGWTTFNGYIGDFFIYNVALGNAERQAIEADLSSKVGIATPRTITATAGTGGSISPSGAVGVSHGGSATFVVMPDIGYAVSQLVVNGVNQGAISSYTFTDVTANHTISASFTTVPTHTLTASAGSNGSISPAGSLVANAGSSKTFTITPDTGYQVANVLVDGTPQGAITSYTFSNIQESHTISASFTPLVLTITASAATGGTISPAGTSNVNYGANQTFTITPNPNYSISSVIVDGTDVGAPSSYTFDSVIENHTISVVFIAGARKIPAANQLLVALDTKDIVGTSSITSWPWLWPTGGTLTNIGSPAVQTINSAKWAYNLYSDSDGFRVGQYTTPIAVNGSTAICAIKPIRNTTSTGWTSIIDVMYGELVLGVSNTSGLPTLRLKKNGITGGTAIPNGQATVLTLVVQPSGAFTVYANGVAIMTGNGPAMTQWVPGNTTNTTANPNAYDRFINVGRNDPDGWTTFNGNIGDVFLYKTALTDTQRMRLEADMMSKFSIGGGSGGNYSITASAGTGGTISPSGTTNVASGANQSYTITPNPGYGIADVQIDGISVGVAGSYTFSTVLANHTISATFVGVDTCTITASAGSGGTINPAGSVAVVLGQDQTFTISPDPGHAISQVTVDSVPQGAISSYTFSNVVTNHEISASFTALPAPTVTLARHAGTGTTSTYGELLSFDVTVTGTPTPTGTVTLKDGGPGGITVGIETLSGGACTIVTSALVAGVHDNIVAVYSGDANYLAASSSALDAQTVNKATPTVTVTGTTGFTYTGAPQGPDTATTGGSTGTVTYSYAGSGGTDYGPNSAKPAAAGSYTVIATVAADPNFNSASSVATPFSIAKATPTVTVTGTTAFSYTGAPQGPDTATTGGSTGAVSYSYAGTGDTSHGPGSGKPTNAGTYTVTATVAADSNYNSASSVATPFTIAKATPVLAVTNSPLNYTGSPQAATVSASVDGAVSNVRYNGSATAPSAAGTYAVTADFAPADTSNHSGLTGATAGNFVILPPLATTTGTATAAAANQTAITVSMPYTDDGNANNTYTVEYKFSAGGSWNTWVANAPHAPSPYATTITGLASGTGYDIRVTYNDEDGVTGANPQTITGVTTSTQPVAVLNAWTNVRSSAPGNAGGTVNVTGQTVSAGSNRLMVVAVCMEASGTPTTMTAGATFGGKALTAIGSSLTNGREFCWMGYLKEADLPAGSNTLAVTYGCTGTNITITGLHVKWAAYSAVDQSSPVLDSNANYNAGASVTFGSQIDYLKGGLVFYAAANGGTPASMSAPTDFSTQSGATSSANGHTSFVGATSSRTSSGNHASTVSVNFGGFTSNRSALVVASLRPAKTTPALVVANSPVTYNGSAQAATVNGSVPGTASNVRYDGLETVPTAAGTYAVTADFVPTDTAGFESLTGAAAGDFVIRKAELTVTATGPAKTYGNALAAGPDTANFTATGEAPGETVTSVLLTPDAAGLSSATPAGDSYVVTPSLATGTGGFTESNYQVTYNPFNGTVGKAAATITLGDLEQTYDGTPRTVSATTDPADLAVAITYGGSSTAPSAAGSYAVVATITDPNHTGSADGTLVVTEDAITTWRNSHFSPEEIAAGLAADDADPDGDGRPNLAEFAFNGDPRSAASIGLFVTRLADGGDGDSDPELSFVCAVRSDAVFQPGPGGNQVSLPVDGLLYTVAAAVDLAGPWDSVVSDQGFSNLPPPGSDLPDLTGTGWHYHTFSCFNALPGAGFLRVGVAKP